MYGRSQQQKVLSGVLCSAEWLMLVAPLLSDPLVSSKGLCLVACACQVRAAAAEAGTWRLGRSAMLSFDAVTLFE